MGKGKSLNKLLGDEETSKILDESSLTTFRCCTPLDVSCTHFCCAHLPLIGLSLTYNLPSWKAVG